jgi:hypothetical protein
MAMKRHWLFLIGVLSFAGALHAQNVKSNQESLTVGGFLNTTFYTQDQTFTFGNGQNAEAPSLPQFSNHKWFYDADVRNSRLWLNFSGPHVADEWKANAYVEMDFFGGWNGNSFASGEQLIPRLRHAYVDLVHSGLTIRIGQWWSPLFGNIPVSLSHLAFPLGYGAAGFPGWRYPGLFLYYNLTPAGSGTNVQLQLAAMKPSDFTAPAAGNGDLNSGMTAGNASGIPQLEARLNFDGKTATSEWGMYVVGHYDKKDLAGVNPADTAKQTTLNGYAGEVGLRFLTGGFSIAGNAYYGRAIGQQFGLLTQKGDIKGVGGWGQVGYNFDTHWGVYAFYGIDRPNKDDVLNAGGTKWQNMIAHGLVRYRLGPYALGLEWLHAALKTGAAGTTTKGNQVSLSMLYTL